MDLDTRLNEISNGIGIEKGEQVEVFINNEVLRSDEGDVVGYQSFQIEMVMNENGGLFKVKASGVIGNDDEEEKDQKQAFPDNNLAMYVKMYGEDMCGLMSSGESNNDKCLSCDQLHNQFKEHQIHHVKFIEQHIVPVMPSYGPEGFEQHLEERITQLQVKRPFESQSQKFYRIWAEFLALFEAIELQKSKDPIWHLSMKSLFISGHHSNLHEGYNWLNYCEQLEGRDYSPIEVLQQAHAWKTFQLPRAVEYVIGILDGEDWEDSVDLYLKDLKDMVKKFYVPFEDVLTYRHHSLDSTILEKLYVAEQKGNKATLHLLSDGPEDVDHIAALLDPISDEFLTMDSIELGYWLNGICENEEETLEMPQLDSFQMQLHECMGWPFDHSTVPLPTKDSSMDTDEWMGMICDQYDMNGNSDCNNSECYLPEVCIPGDSGVEIECFVVGEAGDEPVHLRLRQPNDEISDDVSDDLLLSVFSDDSFENRDEEIFTWEPNGTCLNGHTMVARNNAYNQYEYIMDHVIKALPKPLSYGYPLKYEFNTTITPEAVKLVDKVAGNNTNELDFLRFHAPLIYLVNGTPEFEWKRWLVALFICRNYNDYDCGIHRYNAACLLLGAPMIDKCSVIRYCYAWKKYAAPIAACKIIRHLEKFFPDIWKRERMDTNHYFPFLEYARMIAVTFALGMYDVFETPFRDSLVLDLLLKITNEIIEDNGTLRGIDPMDPNQRQYPKKLGAEEASIIRGMKKELEAVGGIFDPIPFKYKTEEVEKNSDIRSEVNSNVIADHQQSEAATNNAVEVYFQENVDVPEGYHLGYELDEVYEDFYDPDSWAAQTDDEEWYGEMGYGDPISEGNQSNSEIEDTGYPNRSEYDEPIEWILQRQPKGSTAAMQARVAREAFEEELSNNLKTQLTVYDPDDVKVLNLSDIPINQDHGQLESFISTKKGWQ
eukprot:jgi/Chrzof1/7086/Cz02g10100.t1